MPPFQGLPGTLRPQDETFRRWGLDRILRLISIELSQKPHKDTSFPLTPLSGPSGTPGRKVEERWSHERVLDVLL